MKELAFNIKKRMSKGFGRFSRQLKRILHPRTLTVESAKGIPIIINNRNRLTFLKMQIDWFKQNGYTNLYVLDNLSDYPPLLEYYKSCEAKVIRLKKNFGYKALWLSGEFEQFKYNYYVYTDPDVLPTKNCPSDLVFELYKVLQRYSQFEKAGVALRIDDLPEHYSAKAEVLRIEKKWWTNELEKNIYDAPVDTTFALYRPFAWGDAEDCKACRVGGDLIFSHMPWYENSASPTEEDRYYKAAAQGQSSYWMNFK